MEKKDEKIISLIWQAKHHLKERWLLSVELLEDVIAMEPKTREAHELLYVIYMKHNLIQKSKKVMQRALQYFPDNDYFKFLMGNIFLAQKGKSREAISWYNKLKKSFVEMKFNLAVAYSYQNRTKETVKILENIIPRFGYLARTYVFFAEQYLQLKEYDKAIDLLLTAKNKFPTEKKIFYLIGIAYNKKKDWIHAYIHFEKAQKLGYSDAVFYNRWANCCFKMGNINAAINFFITSIQKNIFYTKSYLDLSKLYISEKKFSSAKKYIEIAKRIDPLNIYVTLISQKIKRLFKTSEKL